MTQAFDILGFSPTTTGTKSRSDIPIYLAGLEYVKIGINFGVNNIPINNTLDVIPVNCGYGGFITHNEYEGGSPIMLFAQDLSHIHVTLSDGRNNHLDNFYTDSNGNKYADSSYYGQYYVPNWMIVLELEQIVNHGVLPVVLPQ